MLDALGALPADDAAASVKRGAQGGWAAHWAEPPRRPEGPEEGLCRGLGWECAPGEGLEPPERETVAGLSVCDSIGVCGCV